MKKAVVLGGTRPHVELIRQLRERGYYVILLDALSNPVASGFSDEHHRVSTLDCEAVLEYCAKAKVDLVISSCIDQANVTACYVAEALSLPRPYSTQTALAVTNKPVMKQMMLEAGVPTSRFVSFHAASRPAFDFDFPVIVKPADANSSKGIRVASTQAELSSSVLEAAKVSRTGEVVVEEFVFGEEVGLDMYVDGATPVLLTSRERLKINQPGITEQQITGCIWPADICREYENEICAVAKRIVDSFGLSNTPLLVQAIMDGSRINIIEFAARIGGGENFRIIPLLTGFNAIGASIDSFLNVKPSVKIEQRDGYYGTYFIYTTGGVFDSIGGLSELMDSGGIEYFDALKAPGSVVGGGLASSNRVAVFALRGMDKARMDLDAQEIVKLIKVFNPEGEDIMRRDIYC